MTTAALVAVVWNPQTMEIVRTIELPHLVQPGFAVEVWTTVVHDGLVYVPGRYADWYGDNGIYPGIRTTVLDPVQRARTAGSM